MEKRNILIFETISAILFIILFIFSIISTYKTIDLVKNSDKVLGEVIDVRGKWSFI